MPCGGLKEKVLAAHRAKIDTLVIPRENQKDIKEIPKRVLNSMRVVLVEHMDEVLREALCISDPDSLFGERDVRPLEYIDGKALDYEAPILDDLPDTPLEPPVDDRPFLHEDRVGDGGLTSGAGILDGAE